MDVFQTKQRTTFPHTWTTLPKRTTSVPSENKHTSSTRKSFVSYGSVVSSVTPTSPYQTHTLSSLSLWHSNRGRPGRQIELRHDFFFFFKFKNFKFQSFFSVQPLPNTAYAWINFLITNNSSSTIISGSLEFLYENSIHIHSIPLRFLFWIYHISMELCKLNIYIYTQM